MFDLVLFFQPRKELLKIFGIEDYVYFGEDGDGIIIEDRSPTYIRRFFSKNYKRFIIFGYKGTDRRALIKVLREGLVDFVVRPPIDYVLFKFIKSEGIHVVYPLNELHKDVSKELAYLKELYRICKEKKIPLIVTSFSQKVFELKSRFLIENLLEYIGASGDDIKKIIEENPRRLYKMGLLRKNCSLPGVFYVEKEI